MNKENTRRLSQIGFALHRLINTPLLRARDDDERITRTLFPRWRTMMHPVVTFSSPYFFTPKYLALPSRPFLTEPVPFLCAHSMTAVRGLASATRWCGAMRSVAVNRDDNVVVVDDDAANIAAVASVATSGGDRCDEALRRHCGCWTGTAVTWSVKTLT
jgi:hypothetical protein